MSTEISDAHVHLQDFPAGILPLTLVRARAAGVRSFRCCGTHPGDWSAVAAIAAREPDVTPAYGIHPWHHEAADLVALEERLAADPAAEVGEIGLDATRGADTATARTAQRTLFREQLALAVRFGRAVSVHCVRAGAEVLEDLRCVAGSLPRILLHGFVSSPEEARAFVALGARIGVGERILDPRAARLRRMVAALPREAFALESDAPHGFIRIAALGGLSGPETLPRVASALAEAMGSNQF